MKDRIPTPFESKVLRRIQRGHFQGGDRQVAYSAAARRLEQLGYAMKPGEHWWTTDKGDAYLATCDAEAKNAEAA
jgi:hypothetical protein